LKRFLITASLFMMFAGPAIAQEGGPTPEERYELGLKFMRRGYYTKALEQFNRIRNYHRDHPVSVKAELAIAEMHFKQGDYEQARYAYEDFARLHPRHEDLDLVTYKIGMSIWKRAPKAAGRDQTSTRRAVNTWTTFSSRFPDSVHGEEVDKYLIKARNRLANKELFIARFYARREAWGAVRGRCDRLIKKYREAESVEDALYLGGVAAHAWGDVAGAADYRSRLAEQYPDSRLVSRLDSTLKTEAGRPPETEIFTRPYRLGGAGTGAAGGLGQPGGR